MDNENKLLNQLSDQLQLLVAAVNASISGIIVTDWSRPDNPIIYCNHAFESMTGYHRDEIIGKNCRFLQGDDRDQPSRFKLKDAIAKGEPLNVHIVNYRKDGSKFYNELYIAPVKDNEGSITHYIGVQNDITEKKLTEASVRTEMINTRKLNNQKDAFITAFSHELKTPITSLKGTLQLMNRFLAQEPSNNDKVQTLSAVAERQTNKLSVLVNDLLTSAGLEAGVLAVNKRRFRLADVIDGCCSHFTQAGQHKIKTSGNLQTEVFADQHMIEQVVVNLLDNAIKYSDKTTEIDITISELTDVVKISITDHGVGIKESDRPNVFKRYFKTDLGNINDEGLGLGLYICSEIIERHNGNIGFESIWGQGSKFWFSLPINI